MANPQYVTLTANTVATVTLDRAYNEVEVVNVDGGGSAPIYFTTDGSTPAVNTAGSQFVGSTANASLQVPTRLTPLAGAVVVGLKSAGTPVVMVRGV